MPAFVDVMSIEYSWPGSLHSRISCDSVTCEHFGPTACVNATVKLTVLVLRPSSFNSQSLCTMSVVLRLLWKSTKNFDFENSNDINVSTLMGKIVCTNWRPSCMELHSAVLMNGIFWPFSESDESDMSVGTWCSDIGGIMFREDLLRILRWLTFESYFWLSFAVRKSGVDETTLSECGSEWSCAMCETFSEMCKENLYGIERNEPLKRYPLFSNDPFGWFHRPDFHTDLCSLHRH